jgi:hypothetical protein
MNIASGTPVQKGVNLADINPRDYLAKLMEEKFTGYMCITVKGKTGLEEGTLVFHNGNIVCSDYEYYKYDKKFTAEEGLARIVNCLLASKGLIDTFSLSPYQVQLIMTLNEDSNLKSEVMSSDSLQFPASYSTAYEDSLTKVEKPEEKPYEKEVLLKKYGLSRMMGPKVTRAILLESADEENIKIDKMMDKKAKK